MKTAASLALAIYRETLQAVRADRLVERAWPEDLGPARRIYVVGAGKASVAMAQAADAKLGDRLAEGVVVTKHGHGGPAGRIRVLEAGHPLPDAGSLAAGRAILDVVQQVEAGDLVLCLLSGGASALMELPVEGVTLEDLQQTTRLLLRAGATIDELNALRACLSRLKAGGLARAAYPARVLCLVLSDVLGNPLNIIASGPCYDTPLDPAAALEVLRRYGLTEQAPEAVVDVLSRTSRVVSREETGQAAEAGALHPPPLTSHDSRLVTHLIVGDLWTALDAARKAAKAHGLRPAVLTGWVQGEAREVAQVFAGIARDLPRTAPETGLDCYIAGGETTVTVRGQGRGGRSQELALAAAPILADIEGVALLAGGTDGTDGPTDAAGGVADGGTQERIRAAGWSLERALAENDAYPCLEGAGALIKTGPTQSNVGDLIILIRE